jgi:hypothetical protein
MTKYLQRLLDRAAADAAPAASGLSLALPGSTIRSPLAESDQRLLVPGIGDALIGAPEEPSEPPFVSPNILGVPDSEIDARPPRRRAPQAPITDWRQVSNLPPVLLPRISATPDEAQPRAPEWRPPELPDSAVWEQRDVRMPAIASPPPPDTAALPEVRSEPEARPAPPSPSESRAAAPAPVPAVAPPLPAGGTLETRVIEIPAPPAAVPAPRAEPPAVVRPSTPPAPSREPPLPEARPAERAEPRSMPIVERAAPAPEPPKSIVTIDRIHIEVVPPAVRNIDHAPNAGMKSAAGPLTAASVSRIGPLPTRTSWPLLFGLRRR